VSIIVLALVVDDTGVLVIEKLIVRTRGVGSFLFNLQPDGLSETFDIPQWPENKEPQW
jgi:hypothetical protein